MNTKRILIVDDDPSLRETLSDILRATGYAPTAAAGGKPAVDSVEEEMPAVAIIDLKLPDMSGLELMTEIKERSPGTECIVVTGYASQASAIEAVNLGAYSYVQKPYDVQQLLVTIRRAVEKREAEEALRESEERYRRLVEVSPDVIAVHSQGRIVFINTAGARLLGAATPEQLIGKPAMDFLHPDYREIVKERIRRISEEGKEASLVEEKFIRLDGTVIDVEVVAIPFTYQGKPAVQAIVRDITERKRTEATWRALNAAAAALQRAGLSEAEVYQAATEQVAALGVRGAIIMLDEATDSFVFEHYFVPAGLLRALERLTGFTSTGFRFPRGQVPACAQVVESGEAVYVTDSTVQIVKKLVPESVSRLAGRVAEILGRTNAILAPLRVEDRIAGVLHVAADWLTEADVPAITAFADQLSAALENARLYQAEQERASQLAVVNTIGQRLSTILDADALLNEVVYQVTETLGYYHAAVGLVEGDELVFRVGRGGFEEKGPLPEKRLKIGEEGIAGWVAAHGQPLVVNDVSQEPRFEPDPLVPHVASELAVPLKVQEHVLGVLDVESDRLHAFSETDEALLSTLAGQVAIALDNARLYQDVRRRAEETAALLSTAQAISSLELDAVLETIASQAKALFKADGSRIHLLEPDGETLRCVIALHKRAEAVMAVRLKVGQGFTGRVALKGVPELIPNTLADPQMIQVPGTPVEVEAMAMAPLKVRQRVIGVMTVSRLDEDRPFTPPDLTFLTAFANQAAVAIENARLYDETRRRAEELTALSEVSTALRVAQTVEEMLPIILEETLEVVAAEAGAIFLVDPAAGEMVIPVARGPMETPLVGRRFPLAGSVAETMLHTGEPDISLDLAADPRMPEEMRAVLRGGESGIGLPLRAADVPVGMMAVSWLVPHVVSDDEVRLLTAIANMAASAIHRASLFEELEQRVHELEALFEVGKAVTGTLRVEDLLALVVRVAPQAVHAEGCYLFLWDERQEHLALQVAKGLGPESVGKVRYRLGEGLSGWVFLEERLANVPDVAADPRWKREAEQEAVLPSGQVNSALVVPLIVADKTLGVLGVVNKQRSRVAEEQGGDKETRRQGDKETRGQGEDFLSSLSPPHLVPLSQTAVGFTAADEALLTALAGQVAVALENARLYEDVRDFSLGAIRSLATAIDARDPYTRGHSEGVTELTVRLARELGWSGADLEMLEFAALLHDVGKIAVPDAVLRKAGSLSAEDWNLIHLHPYHSAQIVKPVKALRQIVLWIYHHQEKWDGTGYPDGLKGERIPLAARIIAVADAYNAMTTERPYRRARSHEEAVEEMHRCAGTQFDPKVVETFLSLKRDA